MSVETRLNGKKAPLNIEKWNFLLRSVPDRRFRVEKRFDDRVMLVTPFPLPDGDDLTLHLEDFEDESVTITDKAFVVGRVAEMADLDILLSPDTAAGRIVRAAAGESGVLMDRDGTFHAKVHMRDVASCAFRFARMAAYVEAVAAMSHVPGD